MEITLRTVGDFLDHEHELMIACTGANCGEHKGVDLAELAGRFGRDKKAAALPRVFVRARPSATAPHETR